MMELTLLGLVVLGLMVALFIMAKKWARGRKTEPRRIPKEWLLSILIVAVYTDHLRSLVHY